MIVTKNRQIYPVVDVFAGPGGLGEGFASFNEENGVPRFRNAVSFERDKFSFDTLHLRHFLRSFRIGKFPGEYYRYLRGEITLQELYSLYPENKVEADNSAQHLSLGPKNHGAVRTRISTRLKGIDQWVLVGGPPCQAYSLVGRSRMMGDPDFQKDDRHFLFQEYLQIIIDHAPPIFVMENVKGLLSARVKDELVVNQILSDLACPNVALKDKVNGFGYRLHSLSEDEFLGEEVDPRHFLVRAEEFGVPQARHRIFIVGVRNDVGVVPSRLKRHKPPTLEETIGNLPAIRSGISKGDDSHFSWFKEIAQIDLVSVREELSNHRYADKIVNMLKHNLEQMPQRILRHSTEYPAWPRKRHEVFRGIHDPHLNFLDGHETRGHMPSDLRRYAFATSFACVSGKSPKLADFPESLLPKHSNIKLGCQGKMFSDRFRVQLPDRPSTTVTSHISKDGHYFIHYDPTQCRSLTVREAARIQTFPDNYKFQGPRTEQYHQIGNAVPPYLARQIAAIIAELLDRMKFGK